MSDAGNDTPAATIRRYRIVQNEGARQIAHEAVVSKMEIARDEGELSPDSVIRNFRVTAADGKHLPRHPGSAGILPARVLPGAWDSAPLRRPGRQDACAPGTIPRVTAVSGKATR